MKINKYGILLILVFIDVIIAGIIKNTGLLPWTVFVQYCVALAMILPLVIMFAFAVKEQKITKRTQTILSFILAFVILAITCAALSEIFI